jgi:hypothetical protein
VDSLMADQPEQPFQRTDWVQAAPEPATPAPVAQEDAYEEEVYVVSPSGEAGLIKRKDLDRAVTHGFRLESEEELQYRRDEERYGDQNFRTFLDSAADAASFGLWSAIRPEGEREEVRKMRQINRYAAIGGTVAGSLVTVPGTTGWAAMKAASAVGKGFQGATAGGRIAKSIAQGATEGVVFGVGAGVENAALSGEPMNAENVLGAIGTGMAEGAVLGGVVGGGFRGLAEGARGAKAWHSAFRGADGAAGAPAGSSLKTLMPASKRRSVLADQEVGLKTAREAEVGAISKAREEQLAPLEAERAAAGRDVAEWAPPAPAPTPPPGFRAPDSLTRIRQGVPSFDDAGAEGVLYRVSVDDLERRGLYELPHKADPGHVGKIRSAWDSGKQLDPVQLNVGRDGRLFVDDGRHRLRAALEDGRDVLVLFDRASADEVFEGTTRIAGPQRAAAKAAAAAPQAGDDAVDAVAKAKRKEIRDQFEVELGVIDHHAWQAQSRAKILRDVGGWPDDIVVNANGVKRRVNPMRDLVNEVDTARDEVMAFFPHKGVEGVKKVNGKEHAIYNFTMDLSGDDVMRLMASDAAEDAIAAVARYEKAMLNLHNAVNADGRKALAAADLWLEKTAPADLLGGAKAKLAQHADAGKRLNELGQKIDEVKAAPLTSAKLESIEKSLEQVKAAQRAEGDVATQVKRSLDDVEKASPGATRVTDAEIDEVLTTNGLPNTPAARDMAKLHVAEQRVRAAAKEQGVKAASSHGQGQPHTGRSILGGATLGAAYSFAFGGSGAMGFFGPILVGVVGAMVRGASLKMAGALDRVLTVGAKATGAAAQHGVKTVVPPLLRHLPERERPTYEQAAQQVAQRAMSPEKANEELAPITAAVGSQDPAFAIQMQEVAWRRMQYLSSTMPRSPGPPPALGGYAWEPSDAAKSSWMRRYEAAADPIGEIERAVRGEVSVEGAETLRTVYPEMHSAMKEYIAENIVELGSSLKYESRLAMSVLFNEAIEPTTEPSTTMLLQQNYIAEEEQAGGKMQAITKPELTEAQRIATR